MDKKSKQYLNASRIDYLAHFGQAWIGFNNWYGSPGSRVSEWNQIKDAANNSGMRKRFEDKLNELNTIDPFIKKEVEGLSTCQCKDYTYTLDTTGFQFRLQCTNSNEITKFFRAALRVKALSRRTLGLYLFQPTNQKDALFKKLYSKYSSHMASPDQMVNPYDARNIVKEITAIRADHFGELLIHNLKTKENKSIYSIKGVFGEKYLKKCTALQSLSTVKGAKAVGLEEEYRLKGLNSFERYLYLLYSFRCAYFHGDLDPKNKNAQQCARHALSGLNFLMEALP